MKKLMIAAAIVCAAAFAQAATVTWQSGAWSDLPTCYGWTEYETIGSGDTDGCITAYVWEFAADPGYTSAADVWAAYQKGDLDTANALTGISNVDTGILNVTGADTWKEGDSVYAAILYLHQDLDGDVIPMEPDFYMANVAAGEASNVGTLVGDLGNTFGGVGGLSVSGDATVWTSTAAIPEPTTGLLMLLGMGALALRRRRA